MKTLFVLVTLISIAFSGKAIASEKCAYLLGTCDYYTCESNEMGCSNNDYPIKFGYRYCQKFVEDNQKYTQAGQTFLSKVRNCLQREFQKNPTLTCKSGGEAAAAQHSKCYAEAKFCEIPVKDKLLIGKTVFAKMLGDREFQQAAFKITRNCSRIRAETNPDDLKADIGFDPL